MTNEGAGMKKPILKTNQPAKHPGDADILQLLGDLVRGYSRHHKDLVVHGVKLAGSYALSIQGNKDDHGRLVGEQGKNIRALKAIFERIGRKIRFPTDVILAPPTVGFQGKQLVFEPDPDFRHGATTALLERTLSFCLARSYSLAIGEGIGSTEYELTPDQVELPIIRGDFIAALHAIFHAIGKNRGRIILIKLNDPGAMEDAARALDAVATVKPRTERTNDLDAEVAARGLL